MLKKYMIAILIITLILSMTVTSFADDFEVNEDFVHIVSPVIGTSNKAIVNDTLFISVYVQSENPLLLELTKVPSFNIEETVVEEPVVEESDEVKVSLYDANTQTYEYTKEEILYNYRVAEREKTLLEIELNDVMIQVESIVSIENPSDDELLLLEKADELSLRYNNILNEYYSWKETYLKLFETKILDNIQMAVDPAFPYFEVTVQDIQPGHYHLTIRQLDGSVLERLDFEVVTEEIFADEILEEDLFEDIIDIGF